MCIYWELGSFFLCVHIQTCPRTQFLLNDKMNLKIQIKGHVLCFSDFCSALINKFAAVQPFFIYFLYLLLIGSDHDDEVASLASSSGNCGPRSSHRLPVRTGKHRPAAPLSSSGRARKMKGEWAPVYYGNLTSINVYVL